MAFLGRGAMATSVPATSRQQSAAGSVEATFIAIICPDTQIGSCLPALATPHCSNNRPSISSAFSSTTSQSSGDAGSRITRLASVTAVESSGVTWTVAPSGSGSRWPSCDETEIVPDSETVPDHDR